VKRGRLIVDFIVFSYFVKIIFLFSTFIIVNSIFTKRKDRGAHLNHFSKLIYNVKNECVDLFSSGIIVQSKHDIVHSTIIDTLTKTVVQTNSTKKKKLT